MYSAVNLYEGARLGEVECLEMQWLHEWAQHGRDKSVKGS